MHLSRLWVDGLPENTFPLMFNTRSLSRAVKTEEESHRSGVTLKRFLPTRSCRHRGELAFYVCHECCSSL